MTRILHRPHLYVPDEYEVADQGWKADLDKRILTEKRYDQGKRHSSHTKNGKEDEGEFTFAGLTWRVQGTIWLLKMRFVQVGYVFEDVPCQENR
jgi:hypothetical protein